MNLRVATFLCVGLFLGLIGCKQKYTESYYFSHPQALKHTLQQCQKMGDPENFNAHCKLAYNTALRMTRLIQAFVNNQVEFGQRILRAQIRVADLEAQLHIAEKAHLPTERALRKQLSNAQKNVDNLRAIVGMFMQM